MLISLSQRVAILVEDKRSVGVHMNRIARTAHGVALRKARIAASSTCNALLAVDWKRLCVRRCDADGNGGANEVLHFSMAEYGFEKGSDSLKVLNVDAVGKLTLHASDLGILCYDLWSVLLWMLVFAACCCHRACDDPNISFHRVET